MVPQIATASLSGLNSTIKFIEFAYKVQGVPEEVKQSLELINRVEGDINEARRLLREKHDILDEGLRQRVIRAIDDAEKSRISIGRTVESCRVDMDRKKDSVAMRHRITWVLRDRDAFQTKERNLDYAHKALLHCISEINLLSGISRLQLQPQPQPPPAYRCDPDDEDLEEFLSPRARRARSLLEMKDSPGIHHLQSLY